ncbi:hypothetical protein AK812_SmicGene4965 [Symbiodinium microadriaticum]|uniref:Uncharacterized protein n=1 Tax=Symbiodinium microadriaticum TaxID=2951 RepID=A0A1Q9EUZ5_SYMMI|nr:hypothetical protein AK812_SmicGene4965 [Symbiodinium microadriaticum]
MGMHGLLSFARGVLHWVVRALEVWRQMAATSALCTTLLGCFVLKNCVDGGGLITRSPKRICLSQTRRLPGRRTCARQPHGCYRPLDEDDSSSGGGDCFDRDDSPDAFPTFEG